jgi:hypothetical protein
VEVGTALSIELDSVATSSPSHSSHSSSSSTTGSGVALADKALSTQVLVAEGRISEEADSDGRMEELSLSSVAEATSTDEGETDPLLNEEASAVGEGAAEDWSMVEEGIS